MTNAETSNAKSGTAPRENMQIADRLRTYADLLENQGDDRFCIRAYRAAADQVESMDNPLRKIHREGGNKALIALPSIGRGIAAAIVEILSTGRWAQLERLRGETTPEHVFQTIPGVGPALAERFVTLLDAQDLEELEALLSDQKMTVPGLGTRRRRAVLAALSGRLEPIRRGRSTMGDPTKEPPVSLLLEADALYRKKDAAGELQQIAPRRFNPEGVAWLPILHLRRGDWHLTLLYSNTARAHELKKTKDWVIVFFHQGDAPEAQRSIVTQRQGPLAGRRVVRGREDECALYYDQDPKLHSRLSEPQPTPERSSL
ncbi:MAG: DNA-binding protein [Litorimonas sp.]